MHALPRWLKLFEPFAIIFGIAALLNDMASREEARIVAAWQLLATQQRGNTGKGDAINFLASRGISLAGVEFGLQSVQRGEARSILMDVEVDNADFEYASFSGVAIFGSKILNSHLVGVDFSNSGMNQSSFNGSELDNTDFRYATILNLDMQVGKWKYDVTERINIEQAVFRGGSMQARSFYFKGDQALFLGTDVSEVCMIPHGSVEELPRGVVWGRPGLPPFAIPRTLIYYECDAEPDDFNFILQSRSDFNFDEESYLQYKAGNISIKSDNASCVRRIVPDGNARCEASNLRDHELSTYEYRARRQRWSPQ